MMVAVMALWHGNLVVVQCTLLGSILSNLLFVLGSCFLYGGSMQKELTFSSKAASTCTSLLLLATMSLVLPTSLDTVVRSYGLDEESADKLILDVSRYASLVIFVIYLQFLYFQLVSHKDYFDAEDGDESDKEEEEEKWSMPYAIAVLTLMTIVTAYTADFLVDSIHGYAADMQLSKSFIGLILVASVGNIPEFYVTLMA